MVIINSVFWFYNFETLKLGDNKQDVIIYGVIIDRSDCIAITYTVVALQIIQRSRLFQYLFG